MADTTQTLRRGLPRSSTIRIEKYLGLAALAAGLAGIVAICGSVDGVWHYTKELMGSLYLLAVVVSG